MTLEITDSNFKELLTNSDKPVVVDFWASWCGPCRIVGPIVDELAENYGDSAVVGKLNVDQNPNTPAEMGIRNIPTILFFKNGEIVDKQVGVASLQDLDSKLTALI